MRYVIKEPFDVRIDDKLVTIMSIVNDLLYGHVAVASGPESIGVIVKQWLENRAYQLSDDFLSDPATNSGNTERPEIVLVLRDVDSPERDRQIGAGFEVFHKAFKILFEIFPEHLDRNLVETGRAPVLFNGFKSLAHQYRGDPSRKGVDFEFPGNNLHC